MKKSLIIVESPAKIKTLKKFLGPNYLFASSVGHIRDLPAKEFGIDVENNFEPTYATLPDKKQVIKQLVDSAKQCETVFLCPDPDREGEAIAWHINEILPKGTKTKRVAFHSITKSEVTRALEEPREINKALVNAQQARRLLDRIVGYKISPILNRRIQRGREHSVSAGRVQSVTLKLVVDREKEIEAFNPVEYWKISAILKPPKEERHFHAYLYSIDGKRVLKEPGKEDSVQVNSEKQATEIVEKLRDVPYKVIKVGKKEKKRNPVPPFITSTLQQEASRHHGFSSARTMSVAQTLYEGVDLGVDGTEGLITYMRTDSVRIAPEPLEEVRSFIHTEYGQDFLPAKPRSYSTKKAAQDAHEAIRPTNLSHPPEKVRPFLTKEQFNLYQLVWQRFVASQMNPAIYDTVVADIAAGDNVIVRATGSTLKFEGFLIVYEEKEDDREKEDARRILPNLEESLELNLIDLTSEQAFTRPPPRFTEASLVKELEKSGIGRPSTYATIMNKIQRRDYTVKESGRLKPTELGQIIAQMLETSFKQIMDITFTATMEDDLEQIAEDHKNWRDILKNFWKDFEPTLKIAEKEAFVPKVPTDIECPKCKGKLQKVWYKNKYFYGCSNYPDCDYSIAIEEHEFNRDDYAPEFNWDQKCPECKEEMVVRHGRYGAFLGCSTYPKCRGIIQIPRKGEEVIAIEDLPKCPAIDCPGHLTARRSRFGKVFYSCSTFPDCNVIVNHFDEAETKYPNHQRTAYQKVTKGKGKGRKGAKTAKKTTKRKVSATPFQLSEALAAIVGSKELPRAEILKGVWAYIKEKNLQDPKDKRMIVPDALLEKLFETKEPIKMFQLAGIISKHIHK